MTISPFMRRALMSICGIVPTIAASQTAPKVVESRIGGIYRYLGDTIWHDRDTTSFRVIYGRDSILHTRFTDGRPDQVRAYALTGDSARLVVLRDAAARTVIGDTVGAVVPLSGLRGWSVGLRSAIMSAGAPASAFVSIDWSPERARAYAVAPDVKLVQHRDTLRRITGCPSRRTDTTVFVMYGTDSVRRVSGASRSFGPPMANRLRGEVFAAVNLERIALRPVPIPDDVPRLPVICETGAGAARPLATDRKSAEGLQYVMSYRGDTVWYERDSSVTQSIFVGDTVRHAFFVNDRLLYTTVLRYDGDSGTVVSDSRRPSEAGKRVPWVSVAVAASLLEMTFQSAAIDRQTAESRQRRTASAARFSIPIPPSRDPPRSPETTLTYQLSPNTMVAHHGDTLRYIRGCPGTRTDTTTFVVAGTDSVRRLSPARTFGRVMVVTLFGEIRSSLTDASIRSRNPELENLPGVRICR